MPVPSWHSWHTLFRKTFNVRIFSLQDHMKSVVRDAFADNRFKLK